MSRPLILAALALAASSCSEPGLLLPLVSEEDGTWIIALHRETDLEIYAYELFESDQALTVAASSSKDEVRFAEAVGYSGDLSSLELLRSGRIEPAGLGEPHYTFPDSPREIFQAELDVAEPVWQPQSQISTTLRDFSYSGKSPCVDFDQEVVTIREPLAAPAETSVRFATLLESGTLLVGTDDLDQTLFLVEGSEARPVQGPCLARYEAGFVLNASSVMLSSQTDQELHLIEIDEATATCELARRMRQYEPEDQYDRIRWMDGVQTASASFDVFTLARSGRVFHFDGTDWDELDRVPLPDQVVETKDGDIVWLGPQRAALVLGTQEVTRVEVGQPSQRELVGAGATDSLLAIALIGERLVVSSLLAGVFEEDGAGGWRRRTTLEGRAATEISPYGEGIVAVVGPLLEQSYPALETCPTIEIPGGTRAQYMFVNHATGTIALPDLVDYARLGGPTVVWLYPRR